MSGFCNCNNKLRSPQFVEVHPFIFQCTRDKQDESFLTGRAAAPQRLHAPVLCWPVAGVAASGVTRLMSLPFPDTYKSFPTGRSRRSILNFDSMIRSVCDLADWTNTLFYSVGGVSLMPARTLRHVGGVSSLMSPRPDVM